jgi:hypothetical protein
MKKPYFNSRVVIRKDLRTNKCSIATELTDEELIAIGTITVHWARLEHIIFLSTLDLMRRYKIEMSEEVVSYAFNKRIKAWKKLINKIKTKKEKECLLKLADRVSTLAVKRHRISHGLWDWLPHDPKKLNTSSFRPRLDFKEAFNLQKLIKLEDEIAEINFSISYPKGFASAISFNYGGPSRAFKLRLGKAIKADPWIENSKL